MQLKSCSKDTLNIPGHNQLKSTLTLYLHIKTTNDILIYSGGIADKRILKLHLLRALDVLPMWVSHSHRRIAYCNARIFILVDLLQKLPRKLLKLKSLIFEPFLPFNFQAKIIKI